jgi:hypothetical protein
LVKQVRQFLGKNFYWHDRLAKGGPDSEVVQTLMEMVRGGSVVVIPEQPARSGGVTGASTNAEPSFRGVSDYDPPKYASIKERYRAQLEKVNANPIPWSEIQSMNNSMNTQFMHAAILAAPALPLPVFARAGWISKYGLPDMTGVGFGRVDTVVATIALSAWQHRSQAWRLNTGPKPPRQWKSVSSHGCPEQDLTRGDDG